jgi:hypothetical protein
MAKITDPDLLEDSAVDDGSQEVFINTAGKTIKLNVVGNLSNTGVQNENGVAGKALYSFLKEEWRNDPHGKNLAAFPFPMVPITDNYFEFVDGWDFLNDTARYLMRDVGWTVKNTSGNVTQKWVAIKGLGAIETNDQLYYQQSSGGASSNVQLTGQLNQAIQYFRDDNGNGNTAEGSDFDRSTFLSLFAREESQLYAKASLASVGETDLTAPKVYIYGLGTGADSDITDTDANVAANSPYTQILVRYFDQAYTRDVDSTTDRNFGVVVDVGTHSGVDGSCSASGNTFTTAEGGITGANYTGGTLTIHEGANAGTYTISGTPTATVVTITTTFPSTVANQSFTLQRATPITATAEQIYTKVQYLLRQAADIDSTDQSVTGKTADQLMHFVGDTLVCGRDAAGNAPSNPNGGGSGVVIEGFSATDTNRITFYDNTNTARTYPFVASLTINFGANLQGDASAKYWVYFTTLPGAGNDYGEAGALIVDDNAGADMAGDVGGAPSIVKSFNYDGNVQGGRTAGTDADITVVGIGLATGQYVKATATIARSVSNSVSLVASLERQYTNP